MKKVEIGRYIIIVLIAIVWFIFARFIFKIEPKIIRIIGVIVPVILLLIYWHFKDKRREKRKK